MITTNEIISSTAEKATSQIIIKTSSLQNDLNPSTMIFQDTDNLNNYYLIDFDVDVDFDRNQN